jgi:hypothetical protein
LKGIISYINQGARFPARPDDFESDAVYREWRKSELETIQQLVLAVVASSPDAVRASGINDIGESSRPSSIGSHRASVSSVVFDDVELAEDEIVAPAGSSFTFIPPNPRAYYNRLLEICLDYDLEALRNLPEDEEVSLRILSRANHDLLVECAIRWRIATPTRAVANFDEICKRYSVDEIPLIQCVEAAHQDVDRIAHEHDYSLWTFADVRNDFFLTCFRV